MLGKSRCCYYRCTCDPQPLRPLAESMLMATSEQQASNYWGDRCGAQNSTLGLVLVLAVPVVLVALVVLGVVLVVEVVEVSEGGGSGSGSGSSSGRGMG